MKRLMIILTVSSVFTISAFAEMSTRQGGGMMRGGWWWGMNSGWVFMIIIAILIIVGIFLILERR
jgi:NADH:ubiquinone oxidoreductase subunit 6 (subunit J)